MEWEVIIWSEVKIDLVFRHSGIADGDCTEDYEDHADYVIETEFLLINDPVENSGDQWLYGPDSGNDSDIDTAYVGVIHRHVYEGHDAEEEAAHYQEEQEVADVELTVNYKVIFMPYVIYLRIFIIHY